MRFNDFIWHDAVIKKIEIDRNNPGNNDTIVFNIRWPENNRDSFIALQEVYFAKMDLNFGIVADETISHAVELEESDQDLNNIYSKWRGIIDDKKLKVYKFSLNSTGSKIKIIAKGFREYKL
ncbi:hypothetical protein [Pleomorphovibrio marinus]|uniref:hypothetical protein n=1 Tax=Pleomorphovibrio marinus TaxID=2164132 RepID=UPI000E0AB193|nr:hypothetical protein [Pleomorphovibrio marinus]